MKKSYKLIFDSEVEDVRNIISNNGLNYSDFEISEIEDPPKSGVYSLTGKVRIRHIHSGKVLEYKTGQDWVSSFRKGIGFFN